MDGGGLTDDNDDGGAKWSRGAPTREVAGLDGLTIGARRRGGRDWIPARQRPDAVVAAASRLGGFVSGGRSRMRLASARGNPPGLLARGLFPREKRRETGYEPRVGGLPKSIKIWPGGDWLREIAGIPPEIWTAKVALIES